MIKVKISREKCRLKQSITNVECEGLCAMKVNRMMTTNSIKEAVRIADTKNYYKNM